MGVMDKFLNYMKLNDEDEQYLDSDYLDDDDDALDEPAPVVKKVSIVKETEVSEDRTAIVPKKASPQSKITQMRQPSGRRMQSGNGMEVCVIKPTSIEDDRESLILHQVPASQLREIYRRFRITFLLLLQRAFMYPVIFRICLGAEHSIPHLTQICN